MKRFIDWALGRRRDASSENDRDMGEVMRRVDQQIGRAVTRLSDR